MKKYLQIFRRYLAVMAVTVGIGTLLLVLAACIPDGLVEKNLRESALQMQQEPEYPRIFDHTNTARLDNHTDAIILMESGSLSREDLSTVFTNPYYVQGDLPLPEVFERHMQGEDCGTVQYVRYWMGFRAVIRPLLVLLHYFEIRQYLALGLFSLFLAAVLSVAKHTGTGNAFLLGLSFFLMRPQIICQNIQFTTCFFLAFAFLLGIPWLSRHNKYIRPAFLVMGMTTMYFDFFSTPLVTLGLPLTYLVLLKQDRPGEALREVLADCGLWLLGYGTMWLAKLGLTTLFTPVNGFADGLSSFADWVGIVKNPLRPETYDPLLALRQGNHAFFVDNRTRAIIRAVLLGAVAAALMLGRKGRYSFSRGFGCPGLWVLCLLPGLWFMAAARPTCIHAWFQYRTMIVGLWALGIMYVRGFLPSRRN